MKVQLEKTFDIPAAAEAAWLLLQDIEGVAGCMPGAKITERIDERHYKGTVAVRFGPANMSFRGEVEVGELDAATRTLRLVGKGTDTTGSSAAAMDLTAHVDAVDAASCRLVGTSEVSMSGKAATFGGRMASSVADQVLKQFVANFIARLAANPPPPAAAAPEADGGTAPTAAPASAPAAASPPPAAPLDGLALLWAIVRDWLRSLFGARGT
jgi:uncharacterized protein